MRRLNIRSLGALGQYMHVHGEIYKRGMKVVMVRQNPSHDLEGFGFLEVQLGDERAPSFPFSIRVDFVGTDKNGWSCSVVRSLGGRLHR